VGECREERAPESGGAGSHANDCGDPKADHPS